MCIRDRCNGDICYNACKSVRITNKSCVFIVQDSTIIVDLENIKINKRFIEYSKCIFKAVSYTHLDVYKRQE